MLESIRNLRSLHLWFYIYTYILAWTIVTPQCQGRIQDFQLMGVGQNILRSANIKSTKGEVLSTRVRFESPESSRDLNDLSCNLSLILKHSGKNKRDTKRYSRSNFEGTRACCAPPGSATKSLFM